MRRIISIGATVVCVCMGLQYVFAAQTDLATRDWSVNAADNLAARPPSSDEVNAFMLKFISDKYYVWPGIDGDPQFADLTHSGMLSLIVAASSWKSSPIFVVDRTATGFRISIFNNGPTRLVKDDDNELAFVGYSRFTGYMGAQHCVMLWPVVWGWTGNGYSDVSSQSKAYYQSELARLKNEIAAAEGGTDDASAPQQTPTPQPTPNQAQIPEQQQTNNSFNVTYSQPQSVNSLQPLATPNPLDGTVDCAQAEASRIERFLGISSDAGMTDAIKWSESDNPYDRQFAAQMLADIGTPEAIADLRTLGHDSDKDVAQEAQGVLSDLPRYRQRPPFVPDREIEVHVVPMSWLLPLQ